MVFLNYREKTVFNIFALYSGYATTKPNIIIIGFVVAYHVSRKKHVQKIKTPFCPMSTLYNTDPIFLTSRDIPMQ